MRTYTADEVDAMIGRALARERERVAQQQEPVAWMHWLHGPVRLFFNKDEAQMELEHLNREYPVDVGSRKMRPLVFGDTSPQAQRTWVGLADDEKCRLIKQECRYTTESSYADHLALLEATEAKLKEKNSD